MNMKPLSRRRYMMGMVGKTATMICMLMMMLAMLPCLGSAEADKQEVYIACETYSLRDYLNEGKYDFVSIMGLMNQLDIKGIALNDIWMESYDEVYLDSIRESARENNITIAAFICEGNLATNDEAARRRQIEENAMKMHAAAYLGAPVIRFALGGTGDPERDGTVGVQRVIAAFNELLPLARELNVKMTIENHGGVASKADYILEIIRSTDREWVGACLDFKNWPKDSYYQENAKLARYSYHVHAKSHSFHEDGEEADINYGRVLRMLKNARYQGAISIEFEGPGDQIEGVKKTRDLILRHWDM